MHETRVVPLDGRRHLDENIRQWLGDSRGHWEGDTLVVDTTNFSDRTNFEGAGKNLHLIERWSRVGPDTLRLPIHRVRSDNVDEAVDRGLGLACRG